jgi:hypothetical protein
VLLGLCGLFTVVIGGEWAYLDRKIDQSRLEIDRPVKANVMLDRADDQRLSFPSKTKFSAIVERPLMTMGRQPVADEGSLHLSQGGQPANFPIKVMGIVLAPDVITVLVKDSTDSYHRLRVNESVNGWTLDEIQPNWVIMKQGEVRQRIKLHKPR